MSENYHTVTYYPEACHGFVAQLYAGSDAPTINDSSDKASVKKEVMEDGGASLQGVEGAMKSPSPGDLVLTVLQVRKTNKSYQNRRNAIAVYDLVCMDANHGCVKCRLNSGLSSYLTEDQPVAGSTVIIKSYAVMKMTLEDNPNPELHYELQKRCLLFVKDIQWKASPIQERQAKYDAEGSPVNFVEFDDFKVIHVDEDLLANVMDESVLSLAIEMNTPYEIEDGYEGSVKLLQHPSAEQLRLEKPEQFALLMADKYVAAIVHRHEDDKLAEYQPVAKKAKIIFTEGASCDCARYGYENCVAKILPLEEVDTIDLFRQVKRRLYGRVTAGCWEDLAPGHKRWAFYWSYAVNVFHFRTAEAEPLPSCFEAAVRKAFPSPDGKYTGFKGREERQAEKLLQEGGIANNHN